MDFLTLKVRAPSGGLAFETDFTLHELIPLVRHVTRRLERTDLAASLAGYKAVITPGYDRPVTPAAAPATVAGTVSFATEVKAYFSPGTSPLCTSCPESHRCPGSGRNATGCLDGWIVLDPAAPRTNRPVRYFTVAIESAGGRRLHQEEVSLEPLQPFVSLVSALLRRAGRLATPTRGHYAAELIARYDGQPSIDPMLAPAERSRLAVDFLNLPSTLAESQAPPETLVDWDSLEQEDEIEIQLLATESEALPLRPPPLADRCEAIGNVGQDGLLVYVHRALLAELRHASHEGSAEIEGLLLGEAFLIPEVGRPWIEIAGLLPVAATARRSDAESGDGAFGLLHDRGRLEAAQQGRRTVGWFRSHLVSEVQLASQGSRRLYLAVSGDRLSPTRDERFFHRHFFGEPWHVGLIVDGLEEGLRFYRQQGEDLVACAGFWLLD
jgi:hypothetical protein